MESFEEFLNASKGVSGRIRIGLKAVDEEEQQLLHLRTQLAKIKKIREEQVKKDSLIIQLEEKIAVLEHEKVTGQRQNTELHEIMSDRIATLESHLQEKEVNERVYHERVTILERVQQEKGDLEADLEQERRKCAEATRLATCLQTENDTLRSRLTADGHLSDQFQALFLSLREELAAKEKAVHDLQDRLQHQQQSFDSEISSVHSLLTDMNRQYESSKTQLALLDHDHRRALSENESLRQQLTSHQRLYQESHEQQTTLKQHNDHDKDTLRIMQIETQQLHSRAKEVYDVIHDCQQRLMTITAVLNTTTTNKQQTLVEAVAEVKSMRKSLSSLSSPTEHLKPFFHLITQLLHQLLTQHLTSLTHVADLQAKIGDSHNMQEALQHLQQKHVVLHEDSQFTDGVIEALIEELETQSDIHCSSHAITVKQMKPVVIVHKDGGGVGDDGSSHGKGEGGERVMDSFHSKKKDKLFAKLTGGLRQAITILIQHRSNSNLKDYLATAQAELKALQDKYNQDITQLKQLSEEAYMAVKVNVSESERSVETVHEDYHRKLKAEKALHKQQTAELESLLSQSSSTLTHLAQELEASVEEKRSINDKYCILTYAYHLQHRLLRGYEDMSDAITATALACHSTSASASSPKKKAESTKNRVTFRVAGLMVIAMIHWRKLALLARSSQAIKSKNKRSTPVKRYGTGEDEVKAHDASSDEEEVKVDVKLSARKALQHLEHHHHKSDDSASPRKSVGDQFNHRKSLLRLLCTSKSASTGIQQGDGSKQRTELYHHTNLHTIRSSIRQLKQQVLHNEHSSFTEQSQILQQKQQFQNLFAQKEREIQHLSAQIEEENGRHQVTINSLEAKIEHLESTLQHTQTTHENHQTDIQSTTTSLRQQMHELDRRYQHSQSQFEAEQRALQGTITALQQRNEELQQQLKHNLNQKAKQATIESNNEIELLKQQLIELEKRHHQLKHTAEEEKRRSHAMTLKLEGRIEHLQQTVKDLEQEKLSLQGKLHKAHEILRSTASHALADLRSSISPPPAAHTHSHHARTRTKSEDYTNMSEDISGVFGSTSMSVNSSSALFSTPRHHHIKRPMTANSTPSRRYDTHAAVDSSHEQHSNNSSVVLNTTIKSTPPHSINRSKGSDISPEMHKWTTTSLYQDASFLTGSGIYDDSQSQSQSQSKLFATSPASGPVSFLKGGSVTPPAVNAYINKAGKAPNTGDSDLQEIYADIGRLTKSLETRLREER